MTTNPGATRAEASLGKALRSRHLHWIAAFTLFAGGVGLQAEPAGTSAIVERESFLRAVAEIETGGNTRAVGRHGERGLYQFTQSTWQRYTRRPFAEAHNPVVAHRIATEHFDWICQRLVANGREVTVHRLAMAWNGGLRRALTGVAPRSTRDYARRVTNLAGQYRERAARPATLVAREDVATPVAVLAAVPVAEPDEVQVYFSLRHPEPFAPDVVEVAGPDEFSEKVTFTLAKPAAAGHDSGQPATAPGRRLFFATIGD